MRIVLLSPFAAERSALQQLLIDDGHEVVAVATREEALDLASAAPPDALIADVQVLGIDAPALTRLLSERGLHPRIILVCPRVSRAFERNGVVCLSKPLELAQLRQHLGHERGLENHVA